MSLKNIEYQSGRGGLIIQKIIDESYYDLIVDNSLVNLYDDGENITPMNEKQSLLHIPDQDMDICNLQMYSYSLFPKIFTLCSYQDKENTGIRMVQENPSQAFLGRGVLVGVIDTGIDYTHPAFKYRDGTSRILSIWDQTIQNGTPPEGFTYGTEYSRERINIALKSGSPLTVVPSVDENGHGTAIASIAAGSDTGVGGFSGIVPASDLVVVKLKQAKQNLRRINFAPEDAICYAESDIILAIQYLYRMSRRLRRSLSVCVALATSQGGHDGLGALSSYLDFISQLIQIGVVVAVGNEGNRRRHYLGRLQAETYQNDFELEVGSTDKKFAFEIWPQESGNICLEIKAPTGESSGEITVSPQECFKFSWGDESSFVWVNNIAGGETEEEHAMLVRMQNPQAGIWRLRVCNLEKQDASFHVWLPAGDLLSDQTYFLQANPDTTITTPGSAFYPLSITAYNQSDNSILQQSGRGYTRSGEVIKPELAAPGYSLPCANTSGGYITLTGSGAASAYAAGIVAMILDWAVARGNRTTIRGTEIKGLLIRNAGQQEGNLYPNNIWGYGQINIKELFEKLAT